MLCTGVKYGLSVKENGTMLIKKKKKKVFRKHQHPEIGNQQEDGDFR
jgi:hypothetical protein